MQTQQMDSPKMEAQPLISFIVTCYNLPPDMLKECIGSILALPLNGNEREIILVDDGSDENPMDGLGEWRAQLTYVRQQNGGVSVARNTGIRLCRGTYIQFVDGDDTLIPAQYERCIQLVREKQPDMVLFHLTEKKKTDVSPLSEELTDGTSYMRHNNLRASVCGYVFRKSLLIDLEFSRGTVYSEDEEFTALLMLRTERLYETNIVAYYYRRRSSSVTSDHSREGIQKRLSDSLGVMVRLSDKAEILPFEEREALRRRVSQLTMDYIFNVITLTRNSRYLEQCVSELKKRNLFPLSKHNYTDKYKWFRRISSTKAGRLILCKTLRRKDR